MHNEYNIYQMKPASLSIFLSGLLLSMMVYMLYAGNRMAVIDLPLMEVSKELRLEVMRAYISAGKVSGREGDIDKAKYHIDLADGYVDAILDGGQINTYHLTALQNQMLRQEFLQLQKKMNELHENYIQHHTVQTPVKGAIDQDFTSGLSSLLIVLNRIENVLFNKAQADLASYRNISIALIVTVLAFAFFMTNSVLKSQKKILTRQN